MSRREGKTEAPTQKKKADNRKKGQAARSQDLAPWIAVLAGTYLLAPLGSRLADYLTAVGTELGPLMSSPDPTTALRLLGAGLETGLFAVLPLLGVVAAVNIVAQLLQTGPLLSLYPLKPDFKRVNPLQGFKRLFSTRSLWETLKQVVKAALVGFLCWPHVKAVADLLSQRGAVPLGAGVQIFFEETVATVRATCWALIVVGVFDFAYQRRSKLLDLKMTKQEVRDEMRNSEGDPQVKGRIRSIQLAMARNRMMNDIPSASVVITNPTHIAVALAYDPDSGGAPRVVASGADALAASIRARAAEHGVPIVEAKPLARALWRACEPGDQIPVVLYEAVAKTLAFVRRIKSVTGSAPSSPMPLPGSYRVNEALLEAVPRRQRGRRRR